MLGKGVRSPYAYGWLAHLPFQFELSLGRAVAADRINSRGHISNVRSPSALFHRNTFFIGSNMVWLLWILTEMRCTNKLNKISKNTNIQAPFPFRCYLLDWRIHFWPFPRFSARAATIHFLSLSRYTFSGAFSLVSTLLEDSVSFVLSHARRTCFWFSVRGVSRQRQRLSCSEIDSCSWFAWIELRSVIWVRAIKREQDAEKDVTSTATWTEYLTVDLNPT